MARWSAWRTGFLFHTSFGQLCFVYRDFHLCSFVLINVLTYELLLSPPPTPHTLLAHTQHTLTHIHWTTHSFTITWKDHIVNKPSGFLVFVSFWFHVCYTSTLYVLLFKPDIKKCDQSINQHKKERRWSSQHLRKLILLCDKRFCPLKVLLSVFLLCADQDSLLWLSAGRRSSFSEGRNKRFIPAAWEKSSAVFCSAQPLPDSAEAVRWSVHAGLLPQLWDGSRGEPHSVLLFLSLSIQSGWDVELNTRVLCQSSK